MLINQESVHQRVIYFLGEGASQFARNRCRAKRKHFLKNTNDWPMLRHYPQVLAESDMRVDAVLSSTRADMFILVKLMVPWEDRMGLSTIQKEDKYLDLIIDLKQRGYKVWFFAIEVGARGLVSWSTYTFLREIGLTKQSKIEIPVNMSRAAEAASQWICPKRECK